MARAVSKQHDKHRLALYECGSLTVADSDNYDRHIVFCSLADIVAHYRRSNDGWRSLPAALGHSTQSGPPVR